MTVTWQLRRKRQEVAFLVKLSYYHVRGEEIAFILQYVNALSVGRQKVSEMINNEFEIDCENRHNQETHACSASR